MLRLTYKDNHYSMMFFVITHGRTKIERLMYGVLLEIGKRIFASERESGNNDWDPFPITRIKHNKRNIRYSDYEFGERGLF